MNKGPADVGVVVAAHHQQQQQQQQPQQQQPWPTPPPPPQNQHSAPRRLVRRRRQQAIILLILLASGCTTVFVSLRSSICGNGGGGGTVGRGGEGSGYHHYHYDYNHADSSSSSTSSHTHNVSSSTSTSTRRDGAADHPTDAESHHPFAWVHNEFTDKCFYVENVCRTSHRFFYRRRPRQLSSSSSSPHPPPSMPHLHQQPDLVWDTSHYDLWPPNTGTVHPRYYRFQQRRQQHHQQQRYDNGSDDSSLDDDVTDQDHQCTTSPVTNHLVLFSAFNDMLGEFYDKSIVYLDALTESMNWMESSSTQLYLHLYRNPYNHLLDSHHLFTMPWRSRPLLSVTELWDNPKCECLPRLILCGYEVRHNASGPTGRDDPPYPPRMHHDPLDSNVNMTTSDSTSNTAAEVVVRAGTGWDDLGVKKRAMGRYTKTRNRLLSELVHSKVHVQHDIQQYKNRQLDLLGVPQDKRHMYRLVGLAQRSGRRRWKDLSSLQRSVQTQLDAANRRIALVEMNVEVDSSSYQQLVRHAALDGLIGIHGAQLTEAVWMRNHSWVVELLPYAPPYVIMGHWTRTVHHPTPLGWLYHETGLNHAGYRIPIESTPYCNHNEADEMCWKSHMWDGRDFTVDENVMMRMLDVFFPTVDDALLEKAAKNRTAVDGSSADAVRDGDASLLTPPPLCSTILDRNNGSFVLYNVHCADDKEGLVTPHHYYWPCTEKCDV